MKEYSIFDIIGPIMIGPSSSHTAGAARIGVMAKKIVDEEFVEVVFYLHGSFAKTYKGHGTDKALLAGVLGFLPDDERIKEAYKFADEANISYRFEEADLGDVHCNTVKIAIRTVSGKQWEVTGSSLGAGKARIIKINNMDVIFDGEYTTLIVYHIDLPGVVANITGILAKHNINIAMMKLFRESKGTNSLLVIETDEAIDKAAFEEINSKPNVIVTKLLEPI